ncbi:MAG: hypothetical protein AAGB29_04540 [Planctomycetota bacterium]
MKCTAHRQPDARRAAGRMTAPLARRARRQRGSVLLLVIVSIVLMTVMGATYLQVARVDRFSIEQVEFESGDIDAVVAASLRQIQTALKDDILEIDGSGDAHFLSRDDEDGDLLGDESIDYPYTNPTTPGDLDDMWLAATTPRFHDDDPTGTSYGNPTLSVWPHLTSLLDPITFGTGDEEYIVLPAQGGTETVPGLYSVELGTGTTLADLAPLNTNVRVLATSGTDLSHEISANWERLGADADRDGVPDARWLYAPIRRVGTTEYVMAARIIDNSSLLNVNAASFLSDGFNDFNAFDVDNPADNNQRRPRGYFASDFDLARLAARALNNSGGFNLLAGATPDAYAGSIDDDLNAWMSTRGAAVAQLSPPNDEFYELGLGVGGTTDNPQLNPDLLPSGLNASGPSAMFINTGRLGNYLNADSGTIHYGSATNKYGPADEIELRFENGINGSGNDTSLEGDLVTLTRNDDTAGASGIDNIFLADTASLASGQIRAAEIAYEATGSIGSDEEALASYFQGGLDSVTYANRRFPAIRQMLTTYSGVDTMIPNTSFLAQDVATVRIGDTQSTVNDVNSKFSLLLGEFDWGAGTYNQTNRLNEIYSDTNTGIQQVFRMTDSGGNHYLGGTQAQADANAAQLAVSIIDAMDKEPAGTSEVVTSRTTGGVTYYGLERLPYLREVFLQAGYLNEDLLGDPNLPPTPPVDGLFETWTLQNNSSEAIAIELGNPHDRAIDLDVLNLQIEIEQGGSVVATYSLNGLGITLEAPADIDPATNETDDQHVVYRNPDTPVDEGGDGADLQSDLGLTPPDSTELSGSDIPFDASGGAVTIRLQVEEAGGGFVTYDELVVPWSTPATAVHPEQTIVDYPGEIPTAQFDSHVMHSVSRDGRGLYYLTNFNSTGRNNNTPQEGASTTVTRDESNRGSTYNSVSGNTVDALGEDVKALAVAASGAIDATAGAAALNVNLNEVFDFRFALSVPDHPFLHVSDIGSVFMLNFTTSGGNTTTLNDRLTQALVDHATPPAFIGNYPTWQRYAYLDISPDATVVDLDGAGNGVPHAALLFDRFTIYDPLNDDRDNDADGADEASDPTAQVTDIPERFVPGVMNINTAPAFLAALATPLPEDLDDAEGLFRSIAAYRDYPGVRTTANNYPGSILGSMSTTPGIGSIGELIFVNDNTSDAGTYVTDVNLSAGNGAIQAVGLDGDAADGSGTALAVDATDAMTYDLVTAGTARSYDRYDVLPLPEVQAYLAGLATPIDMIRHGAADGPRERLARFQHLANLFTTRSDVFTAYVVIRGYESGAYNLGPTEQAHYIAVFDRSGLRDADTPVRLVAFERVE